MRVTPCSVALGGQRRVSTQRRQTLGSRLSLWWLLVLLTAQAVWGSGLDIDLNIATMEAPGATLSGLEASVDLSAGSFALSADRVQLGDAAPVEKLSIRCDEGRLELSPLAIDCDRARIPLRHPLLILDDNAASIRWRRESGGRIVLDQVSPLGNNIVLQAVPQLQPNVERRFCGPF